MSKTFLVAFGALIAVASNSTLAPAKVIAGVELADAIPLNNNVQVVENEKIIRRANDGLFYAEAVSNTRRVRFLIDTGASVTVLSHADVDGEVVTAIQNETAGYLKTAGGTSAVKWVVIPKLTVGGMTMHNLRAAVPQHDIGVSLLGQNALSQFRSINIDGDRIKFVS